MTQPGIGAVVTDMGVKQGGGDGVKVPFTQNADTYFERKDGSLYEVMSGRDRLKINDDGSKTKYTSDRKEVCYNNQKGYVFNTKVRNTYMCNCNNYIINEWSCKLTHGYNYVKKVLALENATNKNIQSIKNEIKNQRQDLYNSD